MRNLFLIFVALMAAPAVSVAAVEDKVLSMTTVTIGGSKVSLPKVQLADGSVCQSYVQRTSLSTGNSGGTYEIGIGMLCGLPAVVKGENGFPDEIYPMQLKSLRWVTTQNGMGIHLLELEQ